MRHVLLVLTLVLALGTHTAQASELHPILANLMELQLDVKVKAVPLNKAAERLEEIRAEISKTSNGEEAASLMAATESLSRDIKELGKRAALSSICSRAEYATCLEAVQDL
jgi:hypothetical protein